MAIWVCVKPVNYGRIDYTPDAKIEKHRLIKLPNGIEPDDIIKTHFQLQDDTPKIVEKPISKPVLAMSEFDTNQPDLLRKVEKERSAGEEANTVLNKTKRGRGRPKRR